jgi:iron complex outermembrane receptor protein
VVEPDGIQVQEGDRIPGIPEHNLKAGFDWAIFPNWSVGGTLIYASSFCAAMTVTSSIWWTITRSSTCARASSPGSMSRFGRIDNLFDVDYETGGTRNLNAFADPIAEERFLAPGAPRAGWVGVKLRF